jgi:hypothetical protein
MVAKYATEMGLVLESPRERDFRDRKMTQFRTTQVAPATLQAGQPDVVAQGLPCSGEDLVNITLTAIVHGGDRID